MQTKEYIAYRIKTGDTIKSLAIRIGLDNYKQLRNFHNTVCPQIEYLKTDQLIIGNTLYVPDAQEVNTINKNTEIEILEKDKINPFKLELIKLNNSYKVEISKETLSGKKINKNIITYTLNLKYIEENQGVFILKIDKKNFLINKKKPQTKIQQLALNCSKSYYPINLIINKRCKIIGIENMDEIRERWLKTKLSLQESFTGHYANNYINNVEFKILKTNQLEQIIINDTVLNTLLLPYQRLNTSATKTFNSSFLKHKINFKVSQDVEKDKNNENLIIVEQEGHVEDDRSYKELIVPDAAKQNPFFVKLPKIQGSLNNTLMIDLELGYLKKIKANLKVDYTPNKSKITVINMNLNN